MLSEWSTSIIYFIVSSDDPLPALDPSSHAPCLFHLSVSRMIYTSGRGTTVSTTSTLRRTQTPTMQSGVSSSPTSAGWCSASIPMSSRRERNWNWRTWRRIKWLCFRDGELTFPRVCSQDWLQSFSNTLLRKEKKMWTKEILVSHDESTHVINFLLWAVPDVVLGGYSDRDIGIRNI